MESQQNGDVRIGLPKGRMQEGVVRLLLDAGIRVRLGGRGYRPEFSLEGFEAKLLKPQNVVEMLHAGSRDVGFAGADWVAELDGNLVELLNTELDRVRVVVAGDPDILNRDLGRPPTIASEYVKLAQAWIDDRGLAATVVRSYGATEVFPPEDSDLIIDNTATGTTLRENGLSIIDVVMRSSTRLYAHPAALEDPNKASRINDLVLLLRSVLEARRRVMVEVNVSESVLADVVAVLPCMRNPSISRLHGSEGYAVRAAVPLEQLPRVIPEVKAKGGTDLIVTQPNQIVP